MPHYPRSCTARPTPERHEPGVTYIWHTSNHTDLAKTAPAPDFHELDDAWLGKPLPTPTLEESETVRPLLCEYQVTDIVGHRRGQGRHGPYDHRYRLRLKGYGLEADVGVDKGDMGPAIIDIVYGSKVTA